MGAAVGRAAAVAREVDLLFKEADDPERRRDIMSLAHPTSLRKNIFALKGFQKFLEQTFNLYEHSVEHEQTVASIDPAAYDGSVIDTQ
jgi:hypothetical protein